MVYIYPIHSHDIPWWNISTKFMWLWQFSSEQQPAQEVSSLRSSAGWFSADVLSNSLLWQKQAFFVLQHEILRTHTHTHLFRPKTKVWLPLTQTKVFHFGRSFSAPKNRLWRTSKTLNSTHTKERRQLEKLGQYHSISFNQSLWEFLSTMQLCYCWCQWHHWGIITAQLITRSFSIDASLQDTRTFAERYWSIHLWIWHLGLRWEVSFGMHRHTTISGIHINYPHLR